MTARLRRRWATAMLAVALFAPGLRARGSDHADPMLRPPPSQDANITGLFVFPRGDRMAIILTVHPALLTSPPYGLEDYAYRVHVDLDSAVRYDDAADRARYGGTVADPEGIHPTVTITLRLDDEARLIPGFPAYEGTLSDTESIETFSGVRDDPFIFPRFFRRNVVAMALSIPFSSFPPGQRDWIFWATLTRVSDGEQIDHVGRSNRTQLERLDFLNTLPPSRHVAAIQRKYDSGQRTRKLLNRLASYLPRLGPLAAGFEYVPEVRHYDVFPDVMIFTTRAPSGFPNGRRLEDDVAGLTCAQGDCSLQEVAFIEGGWPRLTVNDKPFVDEFPYLAEPWPAGHPEAVPADHGTRVAGAIVLVAALIGIHLARRRQAREEVPYVRAYRRSL